MTTTSTEEVPVVVEEIKKDKSIEYYLDQVDSHHEETRRIRNSLINQLLPAVQNIAFDINNEKSSDVEKKILAITTLDSLLVSQEKSSENVANIRLKSKMADEVSTSSQLAIEVLKQIKLSDCLQKSNNSSTSVSVEDEQQLKALTDCFDSEIPNEELKEDCYDFDQEKE